MRLKLQADAYMTVYLSLSMTIIMSLILALLQSARISAVKMKTELTVDIAMNSVLGEYNRELFRKYGLLFIDTSYGNENSSVMNTREHLSNYFSKNFEITPIGKLTQRSTLIPAKLSNVDITGYSLASDGKGAVLRRQIQSYMEGAAIDSVIGKIQDNAEKLQNAGLDKDDVENMANSNLQEMSKAHNADLDGDGTAEPYYVDNPAGAVTAQKGIGILPLAAPDLDAISDAAVDSSVYASKRKLKTGTGLDESEKTGIGSDVLLEKYIFEKCGCYGMEKANSKLKYELEYIYAGKDSDYANLEKVAEKLFLWREASNFAYIINDADKMAEADALALTASVLLILPELQEVIKMAIVFAWTFAESISDLRILLTGGKVPIIKSAEDWNLSLENMLEFREHLVNGGGSGLSYEDYLKILILLEKKGKKTLRLMDIIEMNIRGTKGNSNFKIDNCIDILSAEFSVNSVYNSKITIERTYGYEMFD
ncbi:DUF5702 domain-containing protein [Butyrivibrio sp. AE3004]|uniref:DUF5702 domain-containing protein n=1 Tax=Butyrivibrio sp. AE3004 TaxID=1506994 RepID=UPI0018CC74BC|nr:DUF5702 domain-containing protein [Butyrivibrio sp. AE3004]